jgi:hypothetical protein
MAPLVRAFKEKNLPFIFVHCGQHYDYNMSQQFIEELELPKPDFGFKFKEGNNETQWDDKNHIITFRYTEPMTWWMSMPKEMPRTLESALAEARRLAVEKSDPQAMALLTSGFHDQTGQFPALMQDARAKALDAAAKDGVISQEQADWMKSRGFGHGGMMYGYGCGFNNGACPMSASGWSTA